MCVCGRGGGVHERVCKDEAVDKLGKEKQNMEVCACACVEVNVGVRG